MKNKINLAELLKDCPKGMELDCTIWDNVKFDHINMTRDCPIYITIIGGRNEQLTKYGQWDHSPSAKCVIFPKGKTTWKGFTPPCEFKDGDIVATNTGTWIGITIGGSSNKFIPTYCVIKYNNKFEAYLDKKENWRFERLATEEEKQKLFDAIKANGYKWNTETKTLEKLVDDNSPDIDTYEDCPFGAAQLLLAQDVIKWLAENRCASINTINLFESAADICFNIACEKVTEKRDHSKIKRKIDI